MKPKSNISNCTLLTKTDENGPIFDFPDNPENGAAYVNLDGYLICPRQMFSPRQIKAAMKKYYADQAKSSLH